MSEQCETPEYDEGPCHCAAHDPERAASEARADATYFEEWATFNGRRLNDALAEIDRLTSLVGYWEHRAEEAETKSEQRRDTIRYESARADAAIRREDAADAEAEELREEVARLRSAWKSARRRASLYRRAWRGAHHTAEVWRRNARGEGDFARELLSRLTEMVGERDRYRSAWLSARRRAADEANMGAEALDFLRERHEVELRRLRDEPGEKR
ncbi:hypothetical protein ACIGW0_31420 [Streptomyces bikiniensis]|uniref:Uncharacterized protein n=1 Tax=Streptomyces bikiniensis TaxID=1896 RepID=A0ABW8D1X8_STRBI